MLALFLFATYGKVPPRLLTYEEMHSQLMEVVFQDIQPVVLETISHGESLENLCRWPKYSENMTCMYVMLFEVICQEEAPTHLTFMGFENIGTIHYAYLPPDLKCLTISCCEQTYELQTRLLPTNLRELNMAGNKIYGPIDMQNLPRKIEVFDVSQNYIKGPISLQGLPPNLKVAKLWDNRIKQRLVPCDPLPSGVTCVDLTINRVREIRFFMREGEDYGGSGRIEDIMLGMKITTEFH